MKQLLKKFVPANLWEDLRMLKKWRFRKTGDFFRQNPLKTFWVFLKVLFKNFPVIEKLDYGKKTIWIEINSAHELPRLNACRKEPETVQWIENNMRPGDVFYDVGANVGAYSFVAWAVAGGECKVYAFEPSATTFAALSKNILLNQAENQIVPLYTALVNQTGIKKFNYSKIHAGSAGHSTSDFGTPDKKSALSLSITAYKLDELISIFKLEPPNHMKIDVDGAEMEVVEGAANTLKNSALRSLLIELNEPMDPSKKIQRLLENAGLKFVSKHSRMRSKVLFNYIFKR